MSPNRGTLLGICMALIALATAAGCGKQSSGAADRVIKMGTLKLIHGITPYFYEKFTPPGYKVQVIPFESPTDGKNAVVTGTVDFAIYGIAAATLGAAAGEPVVVVSAACNRGMAVMVGAKADGMRTLKDLKGKRVAIWPGSTQEVVIFDRLAAEGMSAQDITAVRVSFSEMPAALERGDVDAYVGAEPAPGISLAKGVGKVLEYPYSTPTGSLNMVVSTSQEMVDRNPALIKVFLTMHRKATEYAMAHRDQMTGIAMQRLGQQRASIELAIPNVELTWNMDETFMKQARYYGSRMLLRKQIRATPDYGKLLNPKFVQEIAQAK